MSEPTPKPDADSDAETNSSSDISQARWVAVFFGIHGLLFLGLVDFVWFQRTCSEKGAAVALRETLPFHIQMVMAGVGFIFLMRWSAFSAAPACAQCGYWRAPKPPHPAACPECGADWNEEDGTRPQRPSDKRWMRNLGIGLLIAQGLAPIVVTLL
ncbi:MAG: hypothetical protein KDA32_11755 [Phycisphaerales bacterium]|nr:hypothetical protein [Phycisphaerales bacterium]